MKSKGHLGEEFCLDSCRSDGEDRLLTPCVDDQLFRANTPDDTQQPGVPPPMHRNGLKSVN